MSPDEFTRAMRLIEETNSGDKEKMHINADALICSLLKQLGYKRGIEIFEEMDVWCA